MRHISKNIFSSLILLLVAFSGCSNHDSDEQSRLEITALDNLPETTAKESVAITLYGTADRDVYVNNVKTARTDQDGTATVSLDTSGADGERRFTILIKDARGHESDAYVVTIVKDADYVEPGTPSKTVTRLSLSATAFELDENGTALVSATAAYKDGTTEEVTPKVIWAVSDIAVVTVENDGTLRAVKEGSSTLSARYANLVSNVVALHVYKVVDGHRLPPEPDPKVNDSTLLGIDSNNNGVRDDVERWIYAEYSHPVVRAVAMQNARAFQVILVDPSRARETLKVMENASDCEEYYKYYADEFNETLLIPKGKSLYKESRPLILNTRERSRAYFEYNKALSGGVYPLRPIKTLKSKCDFNATAVMWGR